MGEVIIPMTEVEHCLICNKHIGKGNDPAICKKELCSNVFEYECKFNKWAEDQRSKPVLKSKVLQSGTENK